MQSLPEYLRSRAQASLQYLLGEVEAVDAEGALRDRRPNWPGQPWGIGQDGSIAGIVYHVAAWMTLTLPLFRSGGQALSAEQFNAAAAPAPDDWPGIQAWLKQAGEEWNAAMEALPDAEFDSERIWEGTEITLTDYITEMIQHDVQHAAQIEYLRQMHLT